MSLIRPFCEIYSGLLQQLRSLFKAAGLFSTKFNPLLSLEVGRGSEIKCGPERNAGQKYVDTRLHMLCVWSVFPSLYLSGRTRPAWTEPTVSQTWSSSSSSSVLDLTDALLLEQQWCLNMG